MPKILAKSSIYARLYVAYLSKGEIMNKAELIEAIATKGKCTKSEAEKGLNVVLDVIGAALKKGEEVAIAGAGKFVVKKRAARKGINPLTKKPITIKASKTVAFKPSKTLKQAL